MSPGSMRAPSRRATGRWREMTALPAVRLERVRVSRRERPQSRGISDLDWVIPVKKYENTERQFAYHYFRFDETKLGGIRTLTMLKALGGEGVSCGYCGYGRLHKSPYVLEGGAWGNCGKRDVPVSLPVTEFLAEHAFLGAPRFERSCDDLIEQYAEAYHKVGAHLEELIEYDKTHDFTQEMKNFSGRTIAMMK